MVHQIKPNNIKMYIEYGKNNRNFDGDRNVSVTIRHP